VRACKRNPLEDAGDENGTTDVARQRRTSLTAVARCRLSARPYAIQAGHTVFASAYGGGALCYAHGAAASRTLFAQILCGAYCRGIRRAALPRRQRVQ